MKTKLYDFVMRDPECIVNFQAKSIRGAKQKASRMSKFSKGVRWYRANGITFQKGNVYLLIPFGLPDSV